MEEPNKTKEQQWHADESKKWKEEIISDKEEGKIYPEPTDPNKLKSSLWATLILVTAFYFNIYLSAKATAAEIAQKDDMDPFKSGIKGEFVAASQNSAFSELSIILNRLDCCCSIRLIYYNDRFWN